jgi:hypothetical protein
MNVPKSVTQAVGKRATGGQPGRWQASMAAISVGAAVGVTVYRVLRSN